MATSEERLVLNVEECATKLGVSPNLVRKMLKHGKLPYIKAGDRWLIPIAALEKMLAEVPAGAKQ